MAKRNPNDRNALAIAKRQGSTERGTFTADNGRVFKLKSNPDLIFIQQASASVTMPEVPTYSVQVGKNTREYPIDPEVIKQTQDDKERRDLQRRWTQYQFDLGDAIAEQTKRTTGAMFYEGVEVDNEMVEADTRWAKKLKIAGWPIPEDEEERWCFYLQTSLSEKEIQRLSTEIVRMAGGASEEQIAAAEELFLDQLSPESGRSDDLEESLADAGGVESA